MNEHVGNPSPPPPVPGAPAPNTSGYGARAVLPPELRRWNWGAFLLNWVWGLGNSTFIALLMFVPFVNLAMPFVLGAKGNEWAWRNRVWRDVAHFRQVQRTWAAVGLMLVVIAVPSCGAMFMSVTGALKNNDAYRTSLSQIRANEEVKAALGEPIEAGYFVTGSINTNGPDGQAALQYSLKGSKAEGEAYVYASKHAGRWILLQVVVESGGHRTAVVGSPDAPLKPEQDT